MSILADDSVPFSDPIPIPSPPPPPGASSVCLNLARTQLTGRPGNHQPIADKLQITRAQLALAWCLKNENVSAVITGASRPEQVVENCAALKALHKLTPEVMAEIDGIVGRVDLDPARQD